MFLYGIRVQDNGSWYRTILSFQSQIVSYCHAPTGNIDRVLSFAIETKGAEIAPVATCKSKM